MVGSLEDESYLSELLSKPEGSLGLFEQLDRFDTNFAVRDFT